MEPPEEQIVSNEHLFAFGAIVHFFARCENLMVGSVERLVGTSFYSAQLIMAEYNFIGKFNTVKALVDASDLSDDTKHAFKGHVGQIKSHNAIRNDVAHSVWKQGVRPNSIKPLSIRTRGGTIIKGLEDKEKDFTPEDLFQIAHTLSDQYNSFLQFLIGHDLIKRMDE